MRLPTSLLCSIGTTLCLLLSVNALAQNPAAPVNPCKGDLKILSQQQSGQTVDIDVEVNVTDCKGSCIGSIEYTLLFADAEGNEIQWLMTENWNWQQVSAPFTVKIHKQAPAGAQLKEVAELKIGRCSCAS